MGRRHWYFILELRQSATQRGGLFRSPGRGAEADDWPPYLDGVIFFVSIIIITCTP